jgi:predicted PurR-regulated permease PerM
MVAGTAAGIYAVAYVSSKAATILVPLVVAVVIGVVAYPLVAKLEQWKIPRSIGALLVLVLMILILAGVAWVTVAGLVDQWPQISSQVQAGSSSLSHAVDSLGAGGGSGQKVVRDAQTAVEGASKSAVSGVLSSAGAGLSGVVSLLFRLFIGALLLYYVLSDMPRMSQYVDAHLGLPGDLGRGVAEDATSSLRGYMRGTTITGAAVAAVIGIGVAIMGVPLAIPIALVTFITCYIPFFGAIISTVFAFLIAFGAKGMGVALGVLALVLVTQNLLETVINAKVMGTSLDLHPLVVLVVTMLGGIFGGLLGAALAAPLLAMVLRARRRIQAYAAEAGRSA